MYYTHYYTLKLSLSLHQTITMKYLLYTFLLLGVFASGQALTSTGVMPITTEVDFNQAEIYQKIKTFAEEYLVNDGIKVTKLEPGKSITLQGLENHKACYLNPKMATKNCFKLDYKLIVTAQDKGYVFEVKDLKAINDDLHPGMSYMHWFETNGFVVPTFKTCVDGTSEYFQAMNKDFKEYIEEGDYW